MDTHTHGSVFFPLCNKDVPKELLVPWSYLYVGEVDAVEVAEHLIDLGGVLQHGAGRLGQVVQRGVPTQGLSKCTHHRCLQHIQEMVNFTWECIACNVYLRVQLSAE